MICPLLKLVTNCFAYKRSLLKQGLRREVEKIILDKLSSGWQIYILNRLVVWQNLIGNKNRKNSDQNKAVRKVVSLGKNQHNAEKWRSKNYRTIKLAGVNLEELTKH